jgi:hypothetical protein
MPKLRGLKASYRLLGIPLGVATLLLIGAGIISQGLPTPIQPARADEVDEVTQQAMVDAINDEYRARAYYQAVIDNLVRCTPLVMWCRRKNAMSSSGRVCLPNLVCQFQRTPLPVKLQPLTLCWKPVRPGLTLSRRDAEMYGNFPHHH